MEALISTIVLLGIWKIYLLINADSQALTFKKGVTINHPLYGLKDCIVAAGFVLVQIHNWHLSGWYFILWLMLLVDRFNFFDYFLDLFRGLGMWYKTPEPKSLEDKILASIPEGLLFVIRVVLFLSSTYVTFVIYTTKLNLL